MIENTIHAFHLIWQRTNELSVIFFLYAIFLSTMSKPRRRVRWNEPNLQQNSNYFETHPVLYKIDEPKTPFVHEMDLPEDILETELPPQHSLDAEDAHSPCRIEATPDRGLPECYSPCLASSPIYDSMSSSDGESWRFEDTLLAKSAKSRAIREIQECDNESPVHKLDDAKESRKKIFESMCKSLREEEMENLKGISHHGD